MIKLKNITLVCVDCVNYNSAINAIEKSIKKIEFGRVLLLSDELFLSRKFESFTIDRINSKAEYSHFMLNKLNDFIETDFCLVIQHDGYVINPQSWTDEFLKYDYIGAPWWYTDGKNVGNGGFSLRSKKLLKACQKENFENYQIEDNTICRDYRELLESKYGIKYAPEQLAAKFSIEPNCEHPVHFIVGSKQILNDSFGFHGIPSLIL